MTKAETGEENVGRGSPLAGLPQDFRVDRPLPLTLRTLTMALIKWIARALELLVYGSKEEMFVMIKEKLDSSGHEHQNVRVGVAVEGEREQVVLQLVEAEEGPFQVSLPRAEEPQASDAKRGSIDRAETEGETSEGDEGCGIAASLEQARGENHLLQEEVGNVEDELQLV